MTNVVPLTPPTPATPLDYALAYARREWRVFPCYTIVNGACACGKPDCISPGKHPVSQLCPRGHRDATIDEAIIRKWWTVYPDANIAVYLAPSKLVAIDIDPRNGGLVTMDIIEGQYGPLLSDITQFTGGGGEHRVFSMDDGIKLPGRLGNGVDVKHNGYIMVEPSRHLSGHPYAWEASSSPLEGCSPSPLPDWLRDFEPVKGEGSAPQASANAPVGARMPITAERLEEVKAALSMIPAVEREIWLHVGFGLHNDIGGQLAYELWTDWSKTVPEKFDPVDQMRNWRSFQRRGFDGITLATVFSYAYRFGFRREQPLAEPLPPAESDAAMFNPALTLVGERAVGVRPFPLTALNELAAWIDAQCPQSHPLAGQAAALAIACACSSRRYVTVHGEPTHLFLSLLGQNVSSVRYAIEAAERAFMVAGLRPMLRSGRIQSPQLIYASLLRSPSLLQTADDWGSVIRAARRQPSGLIEQALAILAGRVHSGTSIALENWQEAGSLKAPPGAQSQPVIHRPAITLLAGASIVHVRDILKTSELARGAIDSMLIVPLAGEEGWRDRPAGLPPPLPPAVIERMRALRGFDIGQSEPTIAQLFEGLALQDPQPITVRCNGDMVSAERAWIDRAQKLRPSMRPLAAGARRNMRRLAAALAAWADPRQPVISHDILAWAYEFVSDTFEATVEEFELSASDEGEKPDAYAQLLDCITRQGSAGMAKRDLHKYCRAYRALAVEPRSELLMQMLGDKAIYEHPTARGKTYVAARFIQEGDAGDNGRQRASPANREQKQRANATGDRETAERT